jgi:hypothetical protein
MCRTLPDSASTIIHYHPPSSHFSHSKLRTLLSGIGYVGPVVNVCELRAGMSSLTGASHASHVALHVVRRWACVGTYPQSHRSHRWFTPARHSPFPLPLTPTPPPREHSFPTRDLATDTPRSPPSSRASKSPQTGTPQRQHGTRHGARPFKVSMSEGTAKTLSMQLL